MRPPGLYLSVVATVRYLVDDVGLAVAFYVFNRRDLEAGSGAT